MRSYLAVSLILVVLSLTPSLSAQACYTPVTSWTGNYTLTAQASGAACSGGDTCDIQQNATVTVQSNSSSNASCTTLGWTFSEVPTSVLLNDKATWVCAHGGAQIQVDTGNSGSGAGSDGILLLNLGSGSGEYFPNIWANVTQTFTDCKGNQTTNSGVDILTPGSTSPLESIVVPATVGTLSLGQSFNGIADFYSAPSGWTVDMTLTPRFDPKDCKDKGHSTIGCQTQSLGEDLAIVGTGLNLHYQSNRVPGGPSNTVAGKDSAMIGGWTLSIHHAYDPATNTLFLGTGDQRNGSELGTPLPYNGNLLLTSEDGSEVYVFSTSGQHLQTLRPMTGAVLYTFGYDAAGMLITATDAVGNITTIQRNASEQPTAIVSPYGQKMTLTVDVNGFLSQVKDPLGKLSKFVNTNTGLLTSRTDPDGNVFHYTYDAIGQLVKDADSLGGYIALTRTDATTGFGWTVGETTALGRTSSYQSDLTLPWNQDGTQPQSEQRTITWPEGLIATSSNDLQNGELENSLGLPDGSSVNETLTADPVWGLQVPVLTSKTVKQGTLTASISGTRSTTLGTAGDPFTVQTVTDSQTINERTYSRTFDGSTHTYTTTSPVGRSFTVGLDSLERVSSTQIAGLTATDYTYDNRGRLASTVQGTRKTSFSYDTNGFLANIIDPLERKVTFANDADGRVTSIKLPDGRVTAYAYDNNGNVVSATPPGKTAHHFSYTAVDLLASYTPPELTGAGATTYSYNLDRDLTAITRPDGEQIKYKYDGAGRLASVVTPTATTAYTYNATTGNTASAANGTEHIAYGYEAELPTNVTWTGKVSGSVSRTYNDNFWISSEEINGANTVAARYDNDGLATKIGQLAITRNSKNGLITGTVLGVTKDSRTYNSFGELIGYTASVNGAAVYSVEYTRDAASRVTAKNEAVNGVTNTYSYTYDITGRLTDVTKNGVADSYTYDSNSNRLSATLSSGISQGTYDAQDRLLTYGNASYGYTANGEITSQVIGSQTTTFSYDVMGNLISATLPAGTKLTYIVDPENHRVGKEVNGVLENGFLYDGATIVAELNGSNQLAAQFVHATGFSPDYMVSGGVTYRIFSDELGSPVLVVNASTGAIAEQIMYDEFGNVLSDTKPGFQPFGFAGGLYDQDLKLVRFGQRDYNPSIGRWMSKDPALFMGNDPNLYAYALSDPINLLDHTGADSVDAGTLRGPQDAGYIESMLRDSLETFNKGKEIYDDCNKLKKLGQDLNQANGTSEFVTGQAENYVKNNTGARNEYKRLENEADKDVPWVKKLWDSLTGAGMYQKSADSLKGKPCKECKNQPQPTDKQPPPPQPMKVWENQ